LSGVLAAPTEVAAGRAAGGRFRARAFGLEIDSSLDAPGLPAAIGEPAGPPTRLDLAPEDEIDRDWPASGAERVLEERFDDGAPARTIDVDPELGYRLYARHFGLARITPGGEQVTCAPPPSQAWSWQRFLVGRILPWASVLRGYEAFHASAVAVGGRVVAFIGPTGAGKTSLALRLVALGADFVTDDVLAVDNPGAVLRAHPGASIASVRPAEREAIPKESWDRLGTVLGHSGKTYLQLPTLERPLPLAAIYFLDEGTGPAVETLAAPDPRLLLASTFVLGVQTPARLMNQLDVCAAIARNVAAFRLRVTSESDAGTLSEAVSAHLTSLGLDL
jgi:hypothetical protein